MKKNDTIIQNLQFLSGGGEMGRLIREKDWTKTTLGLPATWPQSLRTTLSILLNSKFPMFLFWGPELICFYNDAYRPSLGKEGKHPAILGGRAEEYWTEIWHIIKPLIDQVLEQGEATWSEDQLIPIYRNGKIEDVYWTFSYSPVNDESGTPAGVFVTCSETTEKIRITKSLQESEKTFRLLADSLPQNIWTADPGGNLNYFNRSVFDYSGLTWEQISKDGWIQIVHPDEQTENIRLWAESVSTGKDFLFEHRFRRHDGQYRWQLSRAIPLKDEAGNIYMWIGSSTDIHDIKELEQQKDYFISMASHELKTPLTTVKGYVQILQMAYAEAGDPVLQNSLKIIDRQVNTLNKLISELLNISKIKSGRLDLNKERFALNELLREIVDEIKLINPGYNIMLSAENNPVVHADWDRIGQVLINFLTNAIKYAPDSNTIKVSSFLKTDHVVVSVEDFGIGIGKEDQARIFERFYRVEGRDEKIFRGFGIGLFIASEIIQRHDGKINVTSQPGKGSVFSFTLPVN